jgi:SCP-2 sterol transfer family
MASPQFESPAEFREVMDKTFALMDEDPDMGPKLRDADVPQRFEFTDVDLVLNVRAVRRGEEGNLHWEWTDDVDWEPKVRMAMSSETANKYFQGKENVAMAIARRRIKTGGDVKAALALIPITKPLYAMYRDMVAADHPHLVV